MALVQVKWKNDEDIESIAAMLNRAISSTIPLLQLPDNVASRSLAYQKQIAVFQE
jgi:hypothetical protein